MALAADELGRLHERIAGRFARAEPRARVREYVSGLVTGLERKNGWTLAEWAGEVSPDGMQRLLRRPDWDVDGVHDDVRAYVVEQLVSDLRREMSLDKQVQEPLLVLSRHLVEGNTVIVDFQFYAMGS